MQNEKNERIKRAEIYRHITYMHELFEILPLNMDAIDAHSENQEDFSKDQFNDLFRMAKIINSVHALSFNIKLIFLMNMS